MRRQGVLFDDAPAPALQDDEYFQQAPHRGCPAQASCSPVRCLVAEQAVFLVQLDVEFVRQDERYFPQQLWLSCYRSHPRLLLFAYSLRLPYTLLITSLSACCQLPIRTRMQYGASQSEEIFPH